MADPASGEATKQPITDPRDTDVLCGRGGAALRHPGNQTYRRLVNLNKGLYITCLKTEKLKISRSIVAAIREQKGRFLEKDNKQNCWFDIGDKKAVEKTSQALREGQPRLRKKIVEMGGGVAGTAAFMESQYGHTGLYNPEQVGLTSANLDPGRSNAAVIAQRNALRQQEIAVPSMAPPTSMGPPGDVHPDRLMQRLSLSDVSGITGATGSMHSMESRHSGGGMQHRMHRLRPSISNRNSQHGHELGIQESTVSLMSEFSAYNGGNSLGTGSSARGSYDPNSGMHNMSTAGNDSLSHLQMETSFRRNLSGLASLPQSSGHFSGTNLDSFSMNSMDVSGHTPIPVSSINGGYSVGSMASASSASNSRVDKAGPMDRRGVFAKMKFDRPPSDRRPKMPTSSSHLLPGISSHSNDGMSDFNMVESSTSLFSNFSNMTGLDPSNHNSAHQATSSSMQQQQSHHHQQHHQSQHRHGSTSDTYVPPKPIVETAKVIDHSRTNAFSDVMGAGSRHSIMSGLSRISDTSIDHSIFSDLSRKIGNVSTRSLAMSEISTMDIQERDNESTASPRNFGATFHLGASSSIADEAKSDPPLEFQL